MTYQIVLSHGVNCYLITITCLQDHQLSKSRLEVLQNNGLLIFRKYCIFGRFWVEANKIDISCRGTRSCSLVSNHTTNNRGKCLPRATPGFQVLGGAPGTPVFLR